MARLIARFSSVQKFLIAALLLSTMPHVATAQNVEVNEQAAETFRAMVEAYRQRPSLGVDTTIRIEIAQGDQKSFGDEVNAEFLFGPDRQAVVKIRGFTCYLSGGELTAVHDANEDAYFRADDDDSPYWTLFSQFLDLPFPHLGIMLLSKDAVEDLYFQFQPKAMEQIVPTATGQTERDGETLKSITLTGEHSHAEIVYDPKTKLMQSVTLTVTGGPMVQAGTTMTYHHSFEYETFDEPLPKDRFTFDPGDRQRVTMLATLEPVSQPTQPPAMGGQPQQAALVGNEAPEFTLATMNGDAIDLAELEGQVVVLDFWATWCGPCVRALPMLHDVAKWARDEQMPVKIITINSFEGAAIQNDTPDERLKSAQQFWTKHKFTLPVAMDYSDDVATSYGVKGIPTTVVIRSDGVVHAMHSGVSPDYVEQLKADISAALKAGKGGALVD